MILRHATITALVLGVAALTGCDSRQDAKLQEAQRNYAATVKAQQDALQWRLDDATAASLFDENTVAGVNRYLTFRKCHEEPPTHEASRKTCAALQARVAKREAMERAQTAKEKAAW